MSLLGARLEAFLGVHKHKSVTQAAKELNITQTGITQRIRSLEKELGATLFLRLRRGMQLTPEGQHLLNYCDAIRERETELLSKLEGRAFQPISVGIFGPSSVMRWRVVPIISGILQKHPWLRFQLDFSDTSSGVEALRLNKCQLALVARNQVTLELDSKILQAQRYFLTVPSTWKNRNIEDVVAKETIVDFDSEDQMTLNYLRKYGLEPPAFAQRHFASSPDAILELIKAEVGYSVVTEDLLAVLPKDFGVSILKPAHFFDYQIGLAWYPRTAMSKYFSDIIDAIR